MEEDRFDEAGPQPNQVERVQQTIEGNRAEAARIQSGAKAHIDQASAQMGEDRRRIEETHERIQRQQDRR